MTFSEMPIDELLFPDFMDMFDGSDPRGNIISIKFFSQNRTFYFDKNRNLLNYETNEGEIYE